ncbi:sulfotransferase [Gynuella sunshinyii]|uniref:Sulfotransferase n=1 Tax=Gynuella sunshinyii YC6258 TaxID=1445510 RepID=A0A0C5V0W1_9GAMM|nr:sulfotransferase [Gynuella sunshinyii]AJQ93165.1 hypothetical Protein YC6258_01117 [Gynuella sunshinyii YC6258]
MKKSTLLKSITCHNEDFDRSDELANIPVKPVFIMGLHRSGTTFLYDAVAKSFPLAHLTLYHLFYYPKLLSSYHLGREQDERSYLNQCFEQLGIQNRSIDHTSINDHTVEEYGFLLRRHTRSFKLTENNVVFFKEICRKLLAVQKDTQAVLLKNPWDTGNAQWIAEQFPLARFIYISREPMAVLNSMLNALIAYLEQPQAYLEMLLSVDGSRRGYRAGYVVWWILRKLYRLVGEKTIALIARPLLARTVARQIAAYRAEIQQLSAEQAIELNYDELVKDPVATMKRLQPLLDLPLTGDLEAKIKVQQRKNLNPVLNEYQDTLDRLIAKAVQA